MGRYAYLIASSEFADDAGLQKLVGPLNDVDRLSHALGRNDRGQFDVKVFRNEPSYKLVRDLYADLGKRTRDDTILVYFSGHGVLDEDGQLYLSSSDTDRTNVVATAVRALDVFKQMKRSGARERAMILDCCFSGAIGAEFTKADVSQKGQAQLRQISETLGTAILTSSTDIQVSKDGTISPFTEAVHQAINSGDADYDLDGKITLHDLFEYSRKQLASRELQQPTYFEFGSTGAIFISQSGKTKLTELRAAIRQKLLPYVEREDITDSTYQFLLQRFSESTSIEQQVAKEIDLVCDEYVKGKIPFGIFNERLLKIRDKHAARSQPPEDNLTSGIQFFAAAADNASATWPTNPRETLTHASERGSGIGQAQEKAHDTTPATKPQSQPGADYRAKLELFGYGIPGALTQILFFVATAVSVVTAAIISENTYLYKSDDAQVITSSFYAAGLVYFGLATQNFTLKRWVRVGARIISPWATLISTMCLSLVIDVRANPEITIMGTLSIVFFLSCSIIVWAKPGKATSVPIS
jgi:hypothetical protein